MALIGLATPLVVPCDDAGGANPTRAGTLDALVPTWAGKAWPQGSLTKTQTAPGGPWTIWLATGAHTTTDPTPAGGAAGWVAFSSNPTQIPLWQPSRAYPIGEPVRIDTATGMRLFVASKVVANTATASPATTQGATDGWKEVQVTSPPPAPPFSATATYRNGDLVQSPTGTVWLATNAINPSTDAPGSAAASTAWVQVAPGPTVTTRYLATGAGARPQTTDPANPKVGDKFVNSLLGVSWIYADDPQTPGVNLTWVREGQVSFRTNAPLTTATTSGFAATAITSPDPTAVPPRDNDVVFVYNATSGALISVVHL